MAKGRRVIQNLTPFTDTVAANNSTFADAFVKDWDKDAGFGQAMDRCKKRRGQGNKMTPIGKGVATRRS